MAELEQAARLGRESAFHDREAEGLDLEELLVDESFEAPTAVANQHILKEFGELKGKVVLDYGCGSAEGGIYLAKRGAKVVGVDVSQGMLDKAQSLARRHGVDIETRLVTSLSIPAAAGEFDLVYGNGVLHHVPLDTAIPELARVMKPKAVGCFIEPLPYNPIIEVYRRIATKVRTLDERPLTPADIERFKVHFDSVEHREFWLSTLLVFLKFFLVDRVSPNEERYWKKIYKDGAKLASLFAPLQKLDEVLLEKAPALGRLCWITVVSLRGPKQPEP